MMSSVTLEQEIIEAVRQLDEERKQQVLEFVQSLSQADMQSEAWVQKAHEFRMTIRAKYGEDFVFNSQHALDESREERLDDIMGGR